MKLSNFCRQFRQCKWVVWQLCGFCKGVELGTLSKKKCSFNLDFVQNRSDPPPRIFGFFGIFWDTFPKVKTFGTFGTLLCILIHPIFWQKVSQNFWIWSNAPPLSTKNSKKVGSQKVSQNFWFASDLRSNF